jgi:hypothetical protein
MRKASSSAEPRRVNPPEVVAAAKMLAVVGPDQATDRRTKIGTAQHLACIDRPP